MTLQSKFLPNIVLPNIRHDCSADYSAETTFGRTLQFPSCLRSARLQRDQGPREEGREVGEAPARPQAGVLARGPDIPHPQAGQDRQRRTQQPLSPSHQVPNSNVRLE